MKFGYFIDIDERGSFRADVRDETGKTVFEVLAGNELGEDESSLVDDGFMSHTSDIDGLQTYLQSMGVMSSSDTLLSMADFEKAELESSQNEVPRG